MKFRCDESTRVVQTRCWVRVAGLAAAVSLAAVSGLAAQKEGALKPLSGFKIQSTPVLITMQWEPVAGAASYTVERSTTPVGPWAPLPSKGTQLTVASPLAPAGTGGQGLLLYYRVSAIPDRGEPAATIFPYITPSIEAPVVEAWRQDHADLVVYWTPSPWASKYVVTATGGAGGNRYVEVDPPYTSLRLPNLSPGGNQGTAVTVAVNARYEPGSIVAQGPPAAIALAPVNSCWPLATTPGPAPMLAGVRVGVTSISMKAVGPPGSGASILFERAFAGTQAWETLGCLPEAVLAYDVNLQPGTRYDYRLTSVSSVSGTGQRIETRQTAMPYPTPILAAMQSGAYKVYLSWQPVEGADGYRITSSYGYSMLVPQSQDRLAGLTAMNVPLGTYVFTLTVLYPVMQSSNMPPSQVTVTVYPPSR